MFKITSISRGRNLTIAVALIVGMGALGALVHAGGNGPEPGLSDVAWKSAGGVYPTQEPGTGGPTLPPSSGVERGSGAGGNVTPGGKVTPGEGLSPEGGRSPEGGPSPGGRLSTGEGMSTGEDLPTLLAGVYVRLARQVTPSVVQVEVRLPGEGRRPVMEGIPEPFREFFHIPEELESPSQPPPEVLAGGTGFVVSPDGYILTNAHVVDGADRIIVNLADRTSHTAELVGSDPTTDLAVIKVDAKGLQPLAWGSSRDLQVGEPVMAVGNPGFSGAQALDYTVTTGIVSAVGRPLSIIRQSLQDNPDLAGYAIENFIQTDAVINPGNSGGPLVDLEGRVIGVNSAIASSDGHYQGYGFAIPADLARKVMGDLVEFGRARRGWLGITVTGVSSEDAEVYRLPRVGGVLVQTVQDESPAAKAGIRSEDVLLAVNGVPIQDAGDLQEAVAELGPGARANLDVYREGRQETVTAHLGEAPFTASSPKPVERVEEGPEALLGMAVADLTGDLASELGIDTPGGVVVTSVLPWSSAMRKGITPGMRVREVDHTPVRSARGFRQALSGLEGGHVVTLLLEAPDGTRRIVNLRAEAK